MLKKTYMKARPTTNMKKGWLYRNSYDEKNQEIAPMMIQQRRSRSSDDDPDEDDLKMKIIHII